MGKKITMTDIAKAVGVSQTLVSFVLSGKNDMGISADTKKKVLDTARKMGYCSTATSQMLKLGRSGYIVLAFSKSTSVIDSAFLGSICEALQDFGYDLVIMAPNDISAPEQCIQLVKNGRADGVLLLGKDEAFEQHLSKAGVTFRTIDSFSLNDTAECSKQLCEYILDCDTETASKKKKTVHKKKSAAVSGINKKPLNAERKAEKNKENDAAAEPVKRSVKQESIWLL